MIWYLLGMERSVRYLVCFVADTLVLDREVEKDLSAETSLFPELGNNNRTSSRMIKTIEHHVVWTHI